MKILFIDMDNVLVDFRSGKITVEKMQLQKFFKIVKKWHK